MSQAAAARRTHPLQTLLALTTVTLILVVSAALIGLGFYRARNAIIADANQDMRVFSERLVERLNALSTQTVAAVGIISSIPNAFLVPPPGRDRDKAIFLREILKQVPQLDGVYAGYPDGSFFHAVRLGGGWTEALDAPANAVVAYRTITQQAGGGMLDVAFEDAAGNVIREDHGLPTSFDPRTRPWYKAAAGLPETVTIGPYAMATTHNLGIAIAQSHSANRQIVIAADIVLDTITDFLASEKMTPGSEAFIVDTSGNPVIHSDSAFMDRLMATQLPGGTGSLPPDPIVDSIRSNDSWTDAPRLIEAAGRTYLVLVTPIRSRLLLPYHRVVVTAPMDELIAPARRALLHGGAIALLVVVAAVLAALLIARLITQSLQRLTQSAQRLQNLDFVTPVEVRSRVSEISSLSRAMNRARDAIHTFMLYVPKEFVRRGFLAGHFTGRAGARQEVTALFTDIYDFTKISEEHGPEQVVAMLSDYFDILDETVEAHHGSIIQFLGDSIFAMWNAPEADPDHAEHACRAALDACARLETFNESQAAKGLPAFRTRFGIHTGQAVVGSVGARERLQYTAMGDTINVASRLEGMNKETGTAILASRAVRDACLGKIEFRPLGRAQARGRGEAIEIFEVVGVREGPARP
ncbi:adenylate/guanylate cyclase domain-containing protein [Pseudaminobacter soli (ex Zhang et al. 2022)]|uniref:adenylate/guanylate cyclase domain-containing protein n=1 Tax=Pseudaminobacter soli (ex Zhang et al. 2022) TaxID=2831468 RepID=UPI003080AA56